MKVVVIGNSVGLRVRPPESELLNKNLPFSELLKEKINSNSEVKNLCHGRFLVEQMLDLRDEYVREYADVYVICAGITDSCNRDIPLWLSNILHGGRMSFLRRIVMGGYLYIIKPRRGFFVFLRGKKPWRSLKYTERGFKLLFDELLKNTGANIIFLEVLKVDSRVEKELPGSNENVKKLNGKIKVLIKKHPKRMCFLSLEENEVNYSRPDGIHLNSHGHGLLAEKISSTINKLKND